MIRNRWGWAESIAHPDAGSWSEPAPGFVDTPHKSATQAEAVKLVREGSKSLPQMAKDLALTESVLRNRVREGKESAGALSTAEREELVRPIRPDAAYESSDTLLAQIL